MINTYIKPETKTIKVELQQMIAESLPTGDTYTDPAISDAKGFDFFTFEEEEAPSKSDDEDWEDWEEEDDP